MEDKKIEELLRESWSPRPPDGMRERVLRRSREEIARTRPSYLGWRPVFATIAILMVFATGISDHFRQERLSRLMDGASPKMSAPFDPSSLLKQRQQIESLLAAVPTGSLEGDKSL
jgi:hypothetical protein